jgi:23S rRNA (adenine2503-C2)-methyltransferase
MNNSSKTLLTGKTKKELEEYFISIGEKKFRAKQLFEWMYDRRELDFGKMLNLSKELRGKLGREARTVSLHAKTLQFSDISGTKKYLFTTDDNKNIEAVVIPEERRNTLCISSQVGCPLDCKFCATGLMGFKRNLTASEIVQQYLLTQIDYPDEITNIVYMGMGEPLLNYEQTLKSLEIFTAEETRGLSRTRITVSTSGITPKIIALADSGLRVKIALSLHSGFDDIRSKLMPVNKKYPLKSVLEALDYYARVTKTRVTFEYTMFDGINDRDADVKALTKIARRLPSKVNLIPFNSIAHMAPDGISAELKSTPYDRILEFADKLRSNNITVMVRNTQGDDIAAACGQLAVKNQ